MIDINKGWALAASLISTKKKHKDYRRTVDYAAECRAFATGEGLDVYMRPFIRRESPEETRQRLDLTVQVSKSLIHAATIPERKLANVKPVVNTISGAGAEEVVRRLSAFYSDMGVDAYIASLTDAANIDPNSFEVFTFDRYDHRYEEPNVYTFRARSENIYDFEYDNNDLQYLWVRFPINYITQKEYVDLNGNKRPAKTNEGSRFALYMRDHHIVFNQVFADEHEYANVGVLHDRSRQEVLIDQREPIYGLNGEGHAPYIFKCAKNEVYEVSFYNQKTGMVPAFRLGCRPDILTDGRTCVNMWDSGLPYLHKLLMRNSELDLTTRLHAFPRLITYEATCTENGCDAGLMPDKTSCTTCKGTGFRTIQTSAQDAIRVPWPNMGEEFKSLSNIIHYAQFPTEALRAIVELNKDCIADFFKACFGSDVYTKTLVSQTATEQIVEQEAIYDSVQPKTRWWSSTRVALAKLFSKLYNSGDVIVSHKFPRRLRFETTAELIDLRKRASEAGVELSTLIAMDQDILESQLIDDQEQARIARVHQRLNPYPGKSQEAVLSIIAGGMAIERNALLWTEFTEVMRRCVAKYSGKVIGFYEIQEKRQDETVDAVIAEMIAEKKGNAPVYGRMDSEFEEEQIDQSTSTEVQNRALNGAQVEGLSSIVEKVATGVFTDATGRALIKAAFPLIGDAQIDEIMSGIKPVSTQLLSEVK